MNMNDFQRQPGQIQRINQNPTRPKILNSDDGHSGLILPGNSGSRNKHTTKQVTSTAVGNISELPYSNIDVKNRQTQSRNGQMAQANTYHGINIYQASNDKST